METMTARDGRVWTLSRVSCGSGAILIHLSRLFFRPALVCNLREIVLNYSPVSQLTIHCERRQRAVNGWLCLASWPYVIIPHYELSSSALFVLMCGCYYSKTGLSAIQTRLVLNWLHMQVTQYSRNTEKQASQEMGSG